MVRAGDQVAIACKPGVVSPPLDVRADQRFLPFLISLTCTLSRVPGTVTITDWFRDPAANRAAGGADNSLHVAGLAVDLRHDEAGMVAYALWLDAGLDAVDEGDHYHLEWDGPGTIA